MGFAHFLRFSFHFPIENGRQRIRPGNGRVFFIFVCDFFERWPGFTGPVYLFSLKMTRFTRLNESSRSFWEGSTSSTAFESFFCCACVNTVDIFFNFYFQIFFFLNFVYLWMMPNVSERFRELSGTLEACYGVGSGGNDQMVFIFFLSYFCVWFLFSRLLRRPRRRRRTNERKKRQNDAAASVSPFCGQAATPKRGRAAKKNGKESGKKNVKKSTATRENQTETTDKKKATART